MAVALVAELMVADELDSGIAPEMDSGVVPGGGGDALIAVVAIVEGDVEAAP